MRTPENVWARPVSSASDGRTTSSGGIDKVRSKEWTLVDPEPSR